MTLPRMPDFEDELEYLPPEDCARRMGISTAELHTLVRRGAVSAMDSGWGLMVRPTLLV